MAKAKRIYFHQIREHDLRHGASFIRNLEMEVDYITKGNGYTMQFAKDMQVYGVREAVLYVKNNFSGDFTAIDKMVEEITSKLS